MRSNLETYRDAVTMRLAEKRLFDADELRRIRRPAWYRRAAAAYARRHPKSALALARFAESPAESLRDFCTMLEAFHAQIFRPAWEPVHERLLADIAMRTRVLREFGVTALMRTLAPGVSARRSRGGTSVELSAGDARLELDAASVVTLTPSFFCWPGHEAYVVRTREGVRCTIAYPIPPLTARAPKVEAPAAVARACAALGHPVRLRIVELLAARELSTRELAAFLRLPEPAVSRHLRELLHAGLVRRRRSSYFVMYSVRGDAVAGLAGALAALR